MNISKIIYYTIENDKKKTVSLRALWLREETLGLEIIFQIIKDADDIQSLEEKLNEICYEHIEFERETDSYIRFLVIDAYDNTNYLKLKKARLIENN